MYLSNTCTLKTFQQGTLLHESPTHAGTRVCVRRKWRQAQAQHSTGQGQVFFASIATMGMSQKKYLPGQVVHFFAFFLSLLT